MEELRESLLGRIFNKDKWYQKGYKKAEHTEPFTKHARNLEFKEQYYWPALFKLDYNTDDINQVIGPCADNYFVDDKQTIINRLLAWLPSIMTPMGKKMLADFKPKCEINLFQYKTHPLNKDKKEDRSTGYIMVKWPDCNVPLFLIMVNELKKKPWQFFWDRN